MNEATSHPITNNKIESCLDLDAIDIRAEFEEQEIPCNANTFAFLKKYLLCKKTVTTDETDQENSYMFHCCLLIVDCFGMLFGILFIFLIYL